MEGMVRRIGDWGKVENEKVTLSAGEVLMNECTSLLSFRT